MPVVRTIRPSGYLKPGQWEVTLLLRRPDWDKALSMGIDFQVEITKDSTRDAVSQKLAAWLEIVTD